MDDQRRKLLDDHGVLILPEEIKHECYTLIVEAMLLRPHSPILLHCHGEGGDSCVTGAMVDTIRHHGQIIGVLAGEANSSHGVIFAACAQRYVYPGAMIGVHRVAQESLHHVTADYALDRGRENERHDQRNARILAEACTDQERHGYKFWYRKIAANTRALGFIPAIDLISYGFAKPIQEYGGFA